MKAQVLQVKVGKPLESSLERAAQMMIALERGETQEPYFGIGFADMGQFLAVFTPRRWAVLAVLRETGPLTVAELARRVHRDYKNVYSDIEKLREWRVVLKDEQGRIQAPYTDLVVEVCLPQKAAA